MPKDIASGSSSAGSASASSPSSRSKARLSTQRAKTSTSPQRKNEAGQLHPVERENPMDHVMERPPGQSRIPTLRRSDGPIPSLRPSPVGTFFQSSNNVKVPGAQFTSVRDVITINNYHQTTTLQDSNASEDHTNTSPPDIDINLRSSSVPTPTSPEIYTRQLAIKGRGYPLWIPEPNNRLPVEYQKKGIGIGDVGTITPYGAFDFLFNICVPLRDPINPSKMPEDFSPLYPPLDPWDVRGYAAFKSSSHLASSNVKTSQSEKGSILSFKSSASEGAILTMPNGSNAEELTNVRNFKKYASANASKWYKYLQLDRGYEAENGDLRLVVGYDKAAAWGMATFHGSSRENAFRLEFKPVDENNFGRTYGWDYSGMAEVKSGPDLNEMEHLRTLDQADSLVAYPNQCLFVQSITITLQADAWNRLVEELKEIDNADDETEPRNSKHGSSQHFSSNRDPTGGLGIRQRTSGGPSDDDSVRSVDDGRRSESIQFSPSPQSPDTHPSKKINELLLINNPNATIALTEDNDWMTVIEEDDAELPPPEVLYSRIVATHDIREEQGTVFIQIQNPERELQQMSTNSVDELVDTSGAMIEGTSVESWTVQAQTNSQNPNTIQYNQNSDAVYLKAKSVNETMAPGNVPTQFSSGNDRSPEVNTIEHIKQEIRRKPEEVRRKEEEMERSEEEQRPREEDIIRKEGEAKRWEKRREEEERRNAEEEADRKAEDDRSQQERIRREDELRKKESEAKRKVEAARKLEMEIGKKAEEAKKSEEQTRKLQENLQTETEQIKKMQTEAKNALRDVEEKQEQLSRLEEETKKMGKEIRERDLAVSAREKELQRREKELQRREKELNADERKTPPILGRFTNFLSRVGKIDDHPANDYEKKALKAYDAFRRSNGSYLDRSHHLDAAVVHYRDTVQCLAASLPENDPRCVSTKFTLANAQLEARTKATSPRRHLEEATNLHLEVFNVWKTVNPKPEKYFELLCTLGRVHFDLSEMNQDRQKSENLHDASYYYQLSLSHAGSFASSSSEIQWMLGVITCRKCELENNDIQLDRAIQDQLSRVFLSEHSHFFDDRKTWDKPLSVVAESTNPIDRNLPTPRDLALLHLCKALLFRYQYKPNGDPFDLKRAEAVAQFAIRLVSLEVKRPLEEVQKSILKCKNEQHLSPGAGLSIKTSRVFSGQVRQTNTPINATTSPFSRGDPQENGSRTTLPIGPLGPQSPQFKHKNTPINATTSSFARGDLQDNSSRTSLPMGPQLSPLPTPPSSRPSHSRDSSSTNAKGKAKSSGSSQPPLIATSPSQIPALQVFASQ